MVEELILSYMGLAKGVGLKYASRCRFLADECIAEAYFQLCILFYEKFAQYEKAPDKSFMVAVFIKRRLIDYFERFGSRKRKTHSLEADDNQVSSGQVLDMQVPLNMDSEMFNYLVEVMPSDLHVFKVFDFITKGVGFDDIDTVDPTLIQTCQRIRHQVRSRLKRITELQKAGIQTSREVISDSPVETQRGPSEDPLNQGRESTRGSDTEALGREPDQSQTPLGSPDERKGFYQDSRIVS